MIKIWGTAFSLIGDLIMSLPQLNYYKSKYKDIYVNFVIHKKISYCAPLFFNHPLIDKIHISGEWSGFNENDFALSHPGGTLGRRLLTLVSNIMKSGDDIPIVSKETSLIDSLLVMSQKALGMVLITDNNTLLGIFTDGDLRRVLEKNINFQNLSIKDVMTQNCKSIQPNKPALIALQMMEEDSLNSLPVVNSDNQVIGAINMHTLMQAKVS